MFIKDLIMWHHYDVILENSDITMRPWQCLAISDNLNLLSAYVIWNILVLNIKGKVNKIAIFFLIKFHREISLKSGKNPTEPHMLSLYQQGVMCVDTLKIEKLHGMIIGEFSDTIFPNYLFESLGYN
jgi:hypothetical protein